MHKCLDRAVMSHSYLNLEHICHVSPKMHIFQHDYEAENISDM